MPLPRALVPSALAAGFIGLLALVRPALLTDLDRVAHDRFVRHTAPPAVDPRVALVVVDDESLAKFGPWPWPRDRVAGLVTAIRDAGAAAIAFDILFPEADRPGQPAHRDDTPTATDQVLVDAVRSAPVAQGFALTTETPAPGAARAPCAIQPLEPAQRQSGGVEAVSQLPSGTGAVCNVEALGRAASASGTINLAPDADGVLRRVAMLRRLDGHTYPTLALAAVHVAGRPRVTLDTAPDGALSLQVGPHTFALDRHGSMLVRLRGPGRTYPHLSAADVMTGRVPRDALSGRVVFVGATAAGVRDVVATAVDPGFPGIELHATIADTLLGGAGSRRPEFANLLEAVLAVAASVAAVAVVLWIGWLGGSVVVAGGAGAAWFAAQALYQVSGTVVSPVGTIAGLAAGTGIAAAYRVTAGRRRADHERLRREQAQRLIVQTLTSLTETRDLATGHHARRTQEYVRLLASALARNPAYSRVLTSEYIDLIATLAPLHDIGKVGISDAVLNKPGHLNPTETAEMRTHAALGHESLLKAEHLAGVHDNEVLSVAKDIVYTHHERWDGSGYPRGLRGTAIPLPGRIVAVVDVYDALVAERSYKAALPRAHALKIITQGRGIQFDPDVVDAFLQIQHRLDEADHADDVRLPAPPP